LPAAHFPENRAKVIVELSREFFACVTNFRHNRIIIWLVIIDHGNSISNSGVELSDP
jgi:hypothetical protein